MKFTRIFSIAVLICLAVSCVAAPTTPSSASTGQVVVRYDRGGVKVYSGAITDAGRGAKFQAALTAACNALMAGTYSGASIELGPGVYTGTFAVPTYTASMSSLAIKGSGPTTVMKSDTGKYGDAILSLGPGDSTNHYEIQYLEISGISFQQDTGQANSFIRFGEGSQTDGTLLTGHLPVVRNCWFKWHQGHCFDGQVHEALISGCDFDGGNFEDNAGALPVILGQGTTAAGTPGYYKNMNDAVQTGWTDSSSTPASAANRTYYSQYGRRAYYNSGVTGDNSIISKITIGSGETWTVPAEKTINAVEFMFREEGSGFQLKSDTALDIKVYADSAGTQLLATATASHDELARLSTGVWKRICVSLDSSISAGQTIGAIHLVSKKAITSGSVVFCICNMFLTDKYHPQYHQSIMSVWSTPWLYGHRGASAVRAMNVPDRAPWGIWTFENNQIRLRSYATATLYFDSKLFVGGGTSNETFNLLDTGNRMHFRAKGDWDYYGIGHFGAGDIYTGGGDAIWVDSSAVAGTGGNWVGLCCHDNAVRIGASLSGVNPVGSVLMTTIIPVQVLGTTQYTGCVTNVRGPAVFQSSAALLANWPVAPAGTLASDGTNMRVSTGSAWNTLNSTAP